MGNIQNSINQMLGTAAVAAGLYANTDMAKQAKEMKALSKKEATLQKGLEASKADETYQKAMQDLMNEQLETGMDKETYEARADALKRQRASIKEPYTTAMSEINARRFDITGKPEYLKDYLQQQKLAKIYKEEQATQSARDRLKGQKKENDRQKKDRYNPQSFMRGSSGLYDTREEHDGLN